jgi:hypothetical protein
VELGGSGGSVGASRHGDDVAAVSSGLTLGEHLADFGDVAPTDFAGVLAELEPDADRGDGADVGEESELLGAGCVLHGSHSEHDLSQSKKVPLSR